MQFEESIVIQAPADAVFALYADVRGWAAWDPEVREASLEGDFVPGAQGMLRPAKGPTAKIRLVEVEPNRSFTVESQLPLCRMRFEHELRPQALGVLAVHRVTFSGLLAPLLGRCIGGQIRKTLPDTLQGLKHAAEAAVAHSGGC